MREEAAGRTARRKMNFDIIRTSFYERWYSMTSLPDYLIEFKSKVESRLGTVVDFVEDR
jgi:hypothetical protein